MHCARDFRGEILHTQDGEISAVDVIFSDVQFRHFKTRFWLTENSRWVLDKFCTALLISTKTQSVKSDQVIGKKLYIWIGGLFYSCDNQETKMIETILIPEFSPFLPEKPPPAHIDDPERNDGVIKGKFKKVKEVNHKTFMSYGGHSTAQSISQEGQDLFS